MKNSPKNGNSRKGFASLSVERRKAIASAAGKKAHALKKAHEFTHEEAVHAGILSGKKRSMKQTNEKEIREEVKR